MKNSQAQSNCHKLYLPVLTWSRINIFRIEKVVSWSAVVLTVSHYISERKEYAETYSFWAALLPLSVATTIQPISIFQDQTDDAVFKKTNWTKFLPKAWKFLCLKCHWSSVPGGASLAALHFLSTIYLCQLFLFAAAIYITFSLHTVVYMSPVEIKCQLHSYSQPFSVVSSEKQILQLNELFWVCATIIKQLSSK